MAEGPSPAPWTLTKGIVSQKCDAAANHPVRRVAFLAALADRRLDYVQVLIDHTGLTLQEADHLRRFWYSPQGWWPAHYPIEPIIREGLIDALIQAIARNLPLDSYWICGADVVKVLVTSSPHQVTRIIVTPLAP
jgi:hypothetical protein